ncbi:MAG TPA: glutathione S-transferase family protein [Stellaceae bacterium]|nr:glutathione S-transferase family protein [Stellaceae bacterium]
MGMLVDGAWQDVDRRPNAERAGTFKRAQSVFRDQITADGSGGFPATVGRYHLYVSLACPWAHRTIILRRLKGLEAVISMSVVDPLMLEHGWTFGEAPDPVTGKRYLHEVYTLAKPDYTGRVTVPVLWDKQRRTIVNNESAEIIRMLNRAFDAFTDVRTDYYPADLAGEIDALNAWVYETVNNGVYRAGFATVQADYETAVRALFDSLDRLEWLLTERRYLMGDRPTEADWRLFPTLVRFDAVYHGHFKCNLRQLRDYPRLSAYLRELYQMPGIAETVSLDHIKRHYYISQRAINPSQIVPLGPPLDFSAPPGRTAVGAA